MEIENSGVFVPSKEHFSFSIRAAGVGLAILLFSLLFHQWFGPDIWYHLHLGKQILAAKSVYPPETLVLHQASNINIYWLFQIICYSVYAASGVTGLTVLFAALWTLIIFFVFQISNGKKWLPVSIPGLLICILIFKHRFDERPEVFSFLFLALQIWLLEKWDRKEGIKSKWALGYVGIEILWANTHGYFALGLLPIGCKIISAILSDQNSEKESIPQELKLLGLSLVATVLSPLGTQTWEHFLAASKFFSAARSVIQEFLPPLGISLERFKTLWLFWIAWLLTLSGSSFLLFGDQKRGSRIVYLSLMAAAGLILGATSFKNIPLFIILSAPLWGELVRLFHQDEKLLSPKIQLSLIVATAVLSTGLGIWVIRGGAYRALQSPSAFGVGVSDIAYPTQLGSYLEKSQFTGSVFNAIGGGYLQFHFPQLKVFTDTRFMDFQAVSTYFQAIQDPAQFETLDQVYHFDSCLLKVHEAGNLLLSLLKNPKWEMSYSDLHFAFFTKRKASSSVAYPHLYRFYNGQDLTFIPNGSTAITWLTLFSVPELKDEQAKVFNQNFLEAITQFSQAPALPAGIVGISLERGLKLKQKEVLALGLQMLPKVYRPDATQAQALQYLGQVAFENLKKDKGEMPGFPPSEKQGNRQMSSVLQYPR